jgi:hypothetical protein
MAKLEGGIFSRPRGKTGGIVFGAARTRTGKLVTSRLLVPPSNPNTAAQQVQRSKFSVAQSDVRSLGPGIYRDAFNRSIGQLPGFQSLQSIVTKAQTSPAEFTAPAETRLGTIGAIVDVLAVGSAGNFANLSWEGDDNPFGAGASVQAFIFPDFNGDPPPINPPKAALQLDSYLSGGFSVDLSDFAAAGASHALVGVYAIGDGTQAGKYGNCSWFRIVLVA